MGIGTKIKAFTIAEIVVAMMVLSAISMILIPVVMNDSKEKILETSLTKTYTTLQQATQTASMQAMRGEGQITGKAADDLKAAFEDNMRIITIPAKFNEAMAGYLNEDDESPAGIGVTRANTIILKNGVFITFNGDDIILDVNGAKLPNKVGTDIFYFVASGKDGAYSIMPKNDCRTLNDVACAAAKKLKLDKKK